MRCTDLWLGPGVYASSRGRLSHCFHSAIDMLCCFNLNNRPSWQVTSKTLYSGRALAICIVSSTLRTFVSKGGLLNKPTKLLGTIVAEADAGSTALPLLFWLPCTNN